jgi:tetratricopeptide (TPR) repeat protein
MRLLVVLLLLANAARAEDATAQAKRHFRTGARYFQQGKYDRAIDEYQEAQRLLPLPDFDFNLGQAYRLKGDKHAAIEAYERYLNAAPDGDVADQARAHLAKLSAELDALEKQKPKPKPVEVPPPARPPPPPAPELVQQQPPPQGTTPEATPVWKRWWLWTAVGGVAAVGLAVGLGVGLTREPAPPSTTFGTARPFP